MTEKMIEEEAFTRGAHDIPEHSKLQAMSFAELASELSYSTKDSPKYMVIERELKRALAKDQARINRSNVILGALIAGVFSLLGVILGAHLRSSLVQQQPNQASGVQQVNQGQLGLQPQITNVPALPPSPIQPAPATVKPSAQVSKTSP
jgi:hypothetical protein